ncbi:hypothetical protein BN1708_000099, partial [Verticillium longisporum]
MIMCPLASIDIVNSSEQSNWDQEAARKLQLAKKACRSRGAQAHVTWRAGGVTAPRHVLG